MNYRKRMLRLGDVMKRARLDAFLVTDETNVSYLTGFLGHDSMLLVTGGSRCFITDSRYAEEAEETVSGCKVTVVERSTYETIGEIVSRERLKKVGFESSDLPYAVARRLASSIKGAHLVPLKDAVEDIRSVKDAEEIGLIRRAVAVTKEVIGEAVRTLRTGISEEAVAEKVEMEFIKRGARCAFEPIVAFGRNSSKPHARATGKAIGRNGPVMVDIGCKKDGYCADMTRMVSLGRVKDRFRRMLDTVKRAQERAIEKISPGTRIADVDMAARDYIRGEGFGAHFGHALGHGVGLGVHEKPSVSPLNCEMLKPGMVFTVEPAVYIPGFGGVRIEDMVLVTEKGSEVLTQ
ncbi:MAG: Xaa-Pro peptidase family protein [Candidatus Omnitrophota bacterium]